MIEISSVPDPLDRRPDETRQANDALLDYYHMGSGRSVRLLCDKYRNQTEICAGSRPPTRRLSTLLEWSTRHEWQDRIHESVRLDQEAERIAREEALKEEAQKWAKRRLDVREKDWQQAARLRELADKIMDEAPKFLKTTRKYLAGKDGGPDREIVTVAIDAKVMIQALEAASKLQRLAAEMETEHSLSETTDAKDIEEIRQKRWENIQTALADAFAFQEQQPETEADDGGADEA